MKDCILYELNILSHFLVGTLPVFRWNEANVIFFLSIFALGWSIGDPHITTLDGTGYTFNGLGEYTQFLLPSSDGEILFELQSRTRRAIDSKTGEYSQATIFVAFAGQANDSAKVIIWRAYVVTLTIPIGVYFYPDLNLVFTMGVSIPLNQETL